MERRRVAEIDERRRHARVPLQASASWRGGRGDGVLSFDAENISQGGILLHAAVRLEPGEIVTLDVTLPPGFVPIGPRALVVRGEVVRVESHLEGHTSLALAFLDLDSAVEEALAKYVRRKSILERP